MSTLGAAKILTTVGAYNDEKVVKITTILF